MTHRPDGDAATRLIDIPFLFRITVDGEEVGEFQAIDNLERTVEPYEYKEGGRNFSPHYLVGQQSHGELTLRQGQMERETLFRWMEEVEVGTHFRKEVAVFHLTRLLEDRRTLTMHNAWPVAWKAATLDVDDNSIPVEELTLSYEYIELEVSDHEE